MVARLGQENVDQFGIDLLAGNQRDLDVPPPTSRKPGVYRLTCGQQRGWRSAREDSWPPAGRGHKTKHTTASQRVDEISCQVPRYLQQGRTVLLLDPFAFRERSKMST